MAKRSHFGNITKQRSGRFRARYTGPDGRWHNAGTTFLTKTDARAWLTKQHALIIEGNWTSPEVQQAIQAEKVEKSSTTFGSYAETWIDARDLRPRTRQQYRSILDRFLIPTFGTLPLEAITPVAVRAWYATLDPGPTMKAHTYALLRTILSTAVEDDLLAANPCKIRGAGKSSRQRDIKPATLAELKVIVSETPEKYRPMVLLTAWLGMRFGEVTELRRKDINLKDGTVRIERGVSRVEGGFVVGPPKTAAGIRTVAIPPHLLPILRDHLAAYVPADPEALLFSTPTGGHLAPSTVYRWWYPAREAAGREDLRFHDLRHTGATLAAATGATIAELMHRIGHSTPTMAMRYQHAAEDRDRAIADALSEIASGDVVPLRRRSS